MSRLTGEREDPERRSGEGKLAPGGALYKAVSLRHVWGAVGMALCLSYPAFWEGSVGMPRPGTAQASSSRALPGKRVWELLARKVDNSGFQVACVRQGL